MKKWMCFILSAALLFSLAACGGGSAPTAENAPPAAGDIPNANQEPGIMPEENDGILDDAEETALPEIETDAESGQEETNNGGNAAPTSGETELPAAPETAPAEPDQTAPEAQPVDNPPSAAAPQPSNSQPAVSQPEPETPSILIAYFTWADNTHVEDPSTVDVDATTSASVLAPGNAAKMAGWIQGKVGGDLFSIVVAEPYSSDYDTCLDRAADEKAENARPALTNHVRNMDEYDIVFIGFPNWWYTVPMAVLSFVDEYDFSGKTIVPFVTHGTAGLSGTIRDLTAALPDDVTILEAIGVYRPEVDSSRSTVEAWVDGLDLGI